MHFCSQLQQELGRSKSEIRNNAEVKAESQRLRNTNSNLSRDFQNQQEQIENLQGDKIKLQRNLEERITELTRVKQDFGAYRREIKDKKLEDDNWKQNVKI